MAQTLDWGMTAAAVLLFLFGIRALVSKDGRKSLGCSYGIASGLIASWLLKDELGGFQNGLRIGLALLLLLPAVKALAEPVGKNILIAAASLVVAFVVVDEPARQVWNRYAPGAPSRSRELSDALGELRANIESLSERRAKLAAMEDDFRARVEASGPDRAARLESDEGRKALSGLQKVRQLASATEARIRVMELKADEVEQRLADLERGGEALDAAESDPELDLLLREVEGTSLQEDDVIEQYLEQKKLEALYDEEF